MSRSGREVVTAETCRACGVCCVSMRDQEVYCDVTVEDERRLGKRFVRLNVLRPRPVDLLANALGGTMIPQGAIKTAWRQQESGPLKGTEVCACVALRGTVLKKTSCAVYDNRPKACREAVKPGDHNCRALRQMIRDAIERDEGKNG